MEIRDDHLSSGIVDCNVELRLRLIGIETAHDDEQTQEHDEDQPAHDQGDLLIPQDTGLQHLRFLKKKKMHQNHYEF